jgi:hypothetical protein
MPASSDTNRNAKCESKDAPDASLRTIVTPDTSFDRGCGGAVAWSPDENSLAEPEDAAIAAA